MKCRIILLLLILGGFINCKSQVKDLNVREVKETQAILESYMSAAFNNRGVGFNNKVIQNYDNKHWSHLINPFNLRFVQNFDIKTESDLVHFETLFMEDTLFLQKSARNFNIENWTEILDNKYIVDFDPRGLSLSTPAFDRTFTYAIFYLESSSGGDLIMFKKIRDEWVYYASGMVWM